MHRYFATLLLTASVFSFLLCPVSSAKQNERQSARKFVVIPVYYLTDRNQVKNSYGSHRKYAFNCRHDMNYGVAYVAVANTAQKRFDETYNRLSWIASDDRPEKISKKDMIAEPDPASCKEKCFEQLARALDRSQHNDLCLFVHGAADGFEEAAVDAAELGYYMERPVLLYSWPSSPRLVNYATDSQNNEYSQGHFNTLCKDLVAFREHHAIKVALVSHSMGIRMVVRALPLLASTHLIGDLELISPDIDEETFKHYVADYMHNTDGRLRLYTSYKDKLLPLSQMVHGGYYRLGEGADSMFGHSFLLKSRAANYHESNVLGSPEPAGPPSNSEALVTEDVDFTAVDHGFRGHSIPYELVSNMVRHDKPGPGLNLVASRSSHGNQLARLFSVQEPKDADLKGADHFERVVRIKALEASAIKRTSSTELDNRPAD